MGSLMSPPPGFAPTPRRESARKSCLSPRGALSIVMRSAQVEGDMPFQDVRLEGSELTFWWNPGVRVNCALARTPPGGFEGSCAGEGGPEGAGRISMVPPA